MTPKASRGARSQASPSARGARRALSPPTAETNRPPAPLGVPGLAVTLVALACGLVAVTFRIYDPDLWQHLLVGKALWLRHDVIRIHEWSWPRHGTPEVLPSWLFRALVWPFWSFAQEPGLAAWRWLTTALAFGLAWATGRRMGAGPLASAVAAVLCCLVYRQRSMVRPDTLVVVLLAAQLALLERRRSGGRVPAWPLVAIAVLWVNAHISFPLGLLVLGVYAAAEAARHDRPAFRSSLAFVLLLAVAASFLNPFGAAAVWQPFEFALTQRNEPLFRVIGELKPVDWSHNWKNGLPVLAAGWPLLVVLRWSRRSFDPVEAILCVGFTLLGLTGQRFLGYYAVVAAPFVARGLSVLAPRGERPAAWPQAAVAGGLCVALTAVECAQPALPLGLGFLWDRYPVAASDFMARHGVRGRGFNLFQQGGYQAWRFWPERDRLPFIDIHQTGTPEDRTLYVLSLTDAAAWHELDRQRRFDYLLLRLPQEDEERVHDVVEADTTWALVFNDDAAALYVRRGGSLAAVADSFAFRVVGASRFGLSRMGQACRTDPVARRAAEVELRRAIADSPWHARPLFLLAIGEMLDGRREEAAAHLRAALRLKPGYPGASKLLGVALLELGRPGEALVAFDREARLMGADADLDVLRGSAHRALGDGAGASRSYEKALRRDPGSRAARDSLAALGAGPR